MSFDAKKIEYSRERVDIVEIDLDFCSLSFGVFPCTASGSGDSKCYNTLESSQDTANYNGGQGGVVFGIRIDIDGSAFTLTRVDGGSFLGDGFITGTFVTTSGFLNSENNGTFEIDTLIDSVITLEPSSGVVDEELALTGSLSTKNVKTYRFCTQRSPHPININAIPSIQSVSVSPAVLDTGGGLGVRSNVSVTLLDHPSTDKNVTDSGGGINSVNIDPYVIERSYIALERGTYWTKLRSRNPNYQFRDMRVLSGYLNEDGSYDSTNFITRHYVIDSLNVSNGVVKLTGKDPLKLAMSKKAQVPKPSSGSLSGSLTASATTATLSPSGIGNNEYKTSGKILINKEVISFTRSADVLTLTRAQNNTTATTHDSDDTVQQCYEMRLDPDGRIDRIVKDLLINYSGINSSFIKATEWAAEANTHLSYLLDGIIVKPTDVNKILKELTQDSPHYLWWDERSRKIQFTALKPPPLDDEALNMDSNIIKLTTTDKPDLRVSTVIVNFGQFNPTEKLDDIGNYQQSYARIDTESIAKYKVNQIKVINSRWLNVNNKSGAKKLAALIGKRFANTPREISFSLDAKDSDGDSGLWIGKSATINHRDIVDFSGLTKNLTLQITSAKESKNYDFTGLEFDYGGNVTGDEADNSEVIYFSVNELDVNLYDRFDSVFGTPDSSTVAVFIVELGAIIGSSSTSTPAMDMGNWSLVPAGFTIEIQIRSNSFIVGAGGDGQNRTGTPAALPGGLALNITENCTIINNGVIGGGGGGGGYAVDIDDGGFLGRAGGGGGAGSNSGVGKSSSYTGTEDTPSISNGINGTVTNGGAGGQVRESSINLSAIAGKGGNLGSAGSNVGGAGGGDAIDENGNTVTYSTAGDIRGSIV